MGHPGKFRSNILWSVAVNLFTSNFRWYPPSGGPPLSLNNLPGKGTLIGALSWTILALSWTILAGGPGRLITWPAFWLRDRRYLLATLPTWQGHICYAKQGHICYANQGHISDKSSRSSEKSSESSDYYPISSDKSSKSSDKSSKNVDFNLPRIKMSPRIKLSTLIKILSTLIKMLTTIGGG